MMRLILSCITERRGLKSMEKTRQKERTRRKLKEALIRNASSRDYYEITIDDICETAETYRSTFYRYYSSKDELLREIENEYVDQTRSLTSSFDRISLADIEENPDVYRKELEEDMRYHWEHRELCALLLSPGGDLYFHEKMLASLRQTCFRFISKEKGQKENREYSADFFAAGFISSVYEWLRRGDGTPEEMADFLFSVIYGFVQTMNSK